MKIFQHKLLKELEYIDSTVEESLFIESLKVNFCKRINEKYDNVNLTEKKFDSDIYANRAKLSEPDLLIGRKIIFLQSLQNILNTPDNTRLFKHLTDMKNEWEGVCRLPETITHNDIHPLNFMKSDDGKKSYLIDFGKTGWNKRICDFGFVVTSNQNPPVSVVKSMINGYRIKGGVKY